MGRESHVKLEIWRVKIKVLSFCPMIFFGFLIVRPMIMGEYDQGVDVTGMGTLSTFQGD